jgi:hypothetical protein
VLDMDAAWGVGDGGGCGEGLEVSCLGTRETWEGVWSCGCFGKEFGVGGSNRGMGNIWK